MTPSEPLGNPLLEEWTRTYAGAPAGADWAGDVLRRIEADTNAILAGRGRDYARERWAYAVPTPEAVDLLVRLSPLVEVGAGTGYWARLVRDAGGDVVAYDRAPPGSGAPNQYFPPDGGTWTEVRRGDVEALDDHPDRTLLLCWPPYGGCYSPWSGDAGLDDYEPPPSAFPYRRALRRIRRGDLAYRALRRYRGPRVVYVGEGPGGYCAGWAFWHRLRSAWHLVEELDIPQWTGMRDSLRVYERLR